MYRECTTAVWDSAGQGGFSEVPLRPQPYATTGFRDLVVHSA